MERRISALADMPIGSKAMITGVSPVSRGRKKFADMGIVPGEELLVEAHAPFGGLIRIKILGSSVALHRDDAAGIAVKELEAVHA